MTLYRVADNGNHVVKMSHGRYRLSEFLKAATEQGMLIPVEIEGFIYKQPGLSGALYACEESEADFACIRIEALSQEHSDV